MLHNSSGEKMQLTFTPELDKDFTPAVLWNRQYLASIAQSSDREPVVMTLTRPDGTVSRWESFISPSHPQTGLYLERTLKFLLWMKGGNEIALSNQQYATELAGIYSAQGARAFDADFMGVKIYDKPFTVIYKPIADMAASHEITSPLGRHLDGCRIGFDLGGSDRKCAAVQDGKVIFSEEIAWNPYFEKNSSYHIEGIRDSLKRAAAHLPRVDAIGGSSAGVFVNNEVRLASLFRGLDDADFEQNIRRVFFDLQKEWGVPFDVVNDGEVTALAGSMSLNDNAVLGVSMGTSVAAGYVTPEGSITPWLNELAFAPIDYRADGPVDEWSGDQGCAVQYFCQQGVARLAPKAGLEYGDMPFPEQLVEVQELMKKGDERAASIYHTIGACFGYTIAHWADFYDISNLLILGRVTSGEGGEIIIDDARKVLEADFPELAAGINLCTPNEQDKRHGQAIAAASLASVD
jgi:predicted NBD/HSP70 family sugar kinase